MLTQIFLKYCQNFITPVFFILFSTSPLFAIESLKVAADPWCPFSCQSKSEFPGITIEILKNSLGNDFTIEYEELSWSRAVADSRAGKYQAIAGALKSDAPDFIFPQTAVAEQKSCFYVKQESPWSYQNTSQLKGLVIGAVQNYMYGEPMDTYIKNLGPDSKQLDLITGTDTAERLIKKLNDKRIDVMIEDKAVMNYLLKTNQSLQQLSPKEVGCLKAQPLYIAFSPANKAQSKILAEKFNQGFKKLKASKKYSEILSHYGLK